MRKSALIILLVIVVLAAIIFFFTQDNYLESALESSLEAVAEAKVEIDDFHFSLWQLNCSWRRLQIADKNDPWKNILETGAAVFDIEGRPLFWKRFIIRNMELTNVRSGTKRTTDGSLPPEPVEAADAEDDVIARAANDIQKQLTQLPVLDLKGLGKKLKIDSLVDLNNLKSIQEYEQLSHFADSSLNYWQKELKPDLYLKKINELEQQIKDLRLEGNHDVVTLGKKLKALKSIHQNVKTIRNDLKSKYDGAHQAASDLKQQLNRIEQAVKADIARAMELAKLKDLSVKDVGLLLFGAPLIQQLEEVLGYVAIGRKYLPTAKKLLISEKEENPPRFEGQDIIFPFHYRYPRFLVRQAALSGATAAGDTSRAYFLAGEISGLTNEPPVYGKPTRFNLNSRRIDGNHYEISGALDHLTEIPHDSLWVKAENWKLGKINLAKSEYFPQTVQATNGTMNLAGFFIGDRIDLKLNLIAAPVSFEFQKSQKRIAKIVKDVLSALRSIDLKVNLKGQKKHYQLQVNSNIDEVLAGRIKNILKDNVQKARQQVSNYIHQEIAKRKQKIEKQLDQYKQSLLAKLDQAQQKAQEQFDRVEKKKQEIQAKIDAEKNKAKKKAEEQKKKVQDKAKKKLNNLLKKTGNP